MAGLVADIVDLINRMNPGAWRASELAYRGSLPTLGDIAKPVTVSGTLVLTGFGDGDWREFEIAHAGTEFFDNPMAKFADAPGFIILPVLSCSEAEGFRVYVLYDADEYVYQTGTEPGVGGAASIGWTRTGVVRSAIR